MHYFDHNATTPPAPEVVDVFASALREWPANASSTHRAGQAARQQLEVARFTVARSIGSSFPDEVVFTSGGTESNNLAILGLVRSLPSTRRHVITTSIEHPAVLEPFRRLEQEGAEVSFCSANPDEVASMIRPETALVSVMHANNETGAVQSVAEIGRAIRERRDSGQPIYLHSDGVQALGKIDVNVDELGVDLYSVSAHKVYGPKGIGALYVRKGTPLNGIQLGGRQERGRRAGTENVPAAVAFARALELIPDFPLANIAVLRDRFEGRVVSSLEGVEINGSITHRLPNTSNLLFRGLSAEVLLIALDTAGFAVSVGSACSSGSIEPSHVLLAIGCTLAEARSSVRFSFGRCNTPDEVDRLSETVIQIVGRLRRAKENRGRQLVAQ